MQNLKHIDACRLVIHTSILMVSSALVAPSFAATFSVNQAVDNGQVGSLSWAIDQANTAPGNHVIDVTTNVTLTDDMPLLNFGDPGKTTDILGNGNTIDGNGNRIFFADTGTVNLNNMNLSGGVAQGGTGGDGLLGDGSGGGGGMGAGGALFVNDGATVNAVNVDFDSNQANGGNGGNGNTAGDVGLNPNQAGSGGGGGLHGNGSNGTFASGGGGGFYGGGGETTGPPTVTATDTLFGVTFVNIVEDTGGGGGGGGFLGNGGAGGRGGGGGGALSDGGNGGNYDCTDTLNFGLVTVSDCTGNIGGGGSGGGDINTSGLDAPSGNSVLTTNHPLIPPQVGGSGATGSNGAAAGGFFPALNCTNNAGLADGGDGANAIVGGGAGGGAGGVYEETFFQTCNAETDGGNGGDGAADLGGGGGGGAASTNNPQSASNSPSGNGGNGGNGGDYSGGGGGGLGGRAINNSNGDLVAGDGGEGGDGGLYGGGGGSGRSEISSINQSAGGNGGAFGGGGASSHGNAGAGGYGGGGGASAHGTGGDGGFGGGGGGAGSGASVVSSAITIGYPPSLSPPQQGVAGQNGFGAGIGGEAQLANATSTLTDINNTPNDPTDDVWIGGGVFDTGNTPLDPTDDLPFGSGGSGGGGGGLGAGGAVFVRQGGQLNINYTQDNKYNTNEVDGGDGGLGADYVGLQAAYNGGTGQARGQAYFLDDNRANVNIADDFTVVYDETIDDAREISRAGGIDKFNCGTMQFGDDTSAIVMPYGGRTDIYEGEFNIRSDARLLYSTTNIGVTGGTNNCADGPLLSGTGTLADTHILSGAIHDAGNGPGAVGSMTIAGDYSIAGGGALHIDAAPGGIGDQIIVQDRNFTDADHLANPLPAGLTQNTTTQASQVIIDPGAILSVMFQTGTYNNGDEWLLIDNEETDLVTSDGTTAISSADTLGGFAGVSHNLGFGAVTIETNGNLGGISDGNNVVMRFDGNLNCDLTFNENSTLGGSVTLNSTGDVSVAFNGLPDELKCPTLDTMSGEGHVSAAAMLMERSMALTGSIATRVAASWMQDGPAITGVRASQWLATWKRAEEVSEQMELADTGNASLSRQGDFQANPDQYPEGWGAPLEEPDKTTVWGRMLGDARFVAGDGNAADSSRYGAGVMVGADTKTSEHTRLGIALGVGRDWFSVGERRDTSIGVDSVSGSLYGSYTEGSWQSMLVGSIAHQSWETNRHILFPNVSNPAIDRTATAEYEAIYWAIRGELGYLYVSDNDWLIRPSITARWAQLHTGAFHEEGAGDINLINHGETYRSIQTTLGIRASKEMQLDNGWMRTFQFKAEWLHQWAEDYQEAAFSFEGDGTNPRTAFDIRSAEESPASAVLGVGVSFTNDSGLSGFVTGDAIVSPTTFHPSIAAGIKLRF